MKKNFYYDLFSLNESLIGNWTKHFFWPVTTQKTQNILNKILDIYFNIVDEEKNQLFKSCLITYNHTWNPYIILFNYILLKNELEKKGYDIRFSDESRVMNYLYKKTKKFPLVVESLEYKKKLIKPIKDKIKTILFNFKNLKFDFTEQFFVINNKGIVENKGKKK